MHSLKSLCLRELASSKVYTHLDPQVRTAELLVTRQALQMRGQHQTLSQHGGSLQICLRITSKDIGRDRKEVILLAYAWLFCTSACPPTRWDFGRWQRSLLDSAQRLLNARKSIPHFVSQMLRFTLNVLRAFAHVLNFAIDRLNSIYGSANSLNLTLHLCGIDFGKG